ncbi:hypothetical protein FIBSPDRAFT_452708 [Athelia psychrophila]|uniref:UFSP1/2/DUB catalytic domain-containing protein n=1 Tax=Athelia psychrophila TaxID=1759441 RepID=A0A166M5T5_9AGAM|nr:hypothetical protein FIBSPDRAFT_452708 [Fibularhizoctonia sp. CBS 109695]
MRCEMCKTDISNWPVEQRQAHYERHFADSAPVASPSRKRDPLIASTSARARIMQSPSKLKEYWRKPETDTFWHNAQAGVDPPPKNFSPGLIPVLRQALTQSHSKGKTQRAVLCYDKTVHIAREFWDVGWGCGYRNFLMACTALMEQPVQPMYFALLDDASPPSVRNLQHLIESAWREGYDRDGARDLKHKLAGTTKWIGTAELYTAFTYRRIPCALVDFDLKKQDKDRAVKGVINWVVNYFSPPILGKVKTSIDDALRGAAPVVCTDKMPLILQHDGHSRTIVGYEVDRRGVVNLLTFCPSRLIPKPLRKLGLAALSPASVSTSREAEGASAQTGLGRARTTSTSTSRVLQHILHPIHKEKRHGAGSGQTANDEKDVIVIPDDDDDDGPKPQPTTKLTHPARINPEHKLDPLEIINFFRLDPKALGKKNEYQILYFPMDDPLSPREQLARKEVFSTKIS